MWPLLMKLFLLVFTAYSAGILAQLFRQSAIVGYLLAGSIVGALLFRDPQAVAGGQAGRSGDRHHAGADWRIRLRPGGRRTG